jgi:hypothetical protein
MNDEEIINKAYSKGIIHPQLCSQCGVVECATCLDEVKKLLKLIRADERSRILKILKEEFAKLNKGVTKNNDDTVWAGMGMTVFDFLGHIMTRVRMNEVK